MFCCTNSGSEGQLSGRDTGWVGRIKGQTRSSEEQHGQLIHRAVEHVILVQLTLLSVSRAALNVCDWVPERLSETTALWMPWLET